MLSKFTQIAQLGQSLWLDFISRPLLKTNQLAALVDEGLLGLTSNPTIFQQAIAEGRDYDAQIKQAADEGLDAQATFEAIAIADVGAAADVMYPVYDKTHGRDGFVSIEVRPSLAHDTDGTVAEGRRLFQALNRPNVMIKVPATEAGLPAITTLLSEGINVNVTLIFAIAMYQRVIQAYLDGLDQAATAGRDVATLASVASFFVSRVDSLVDKQLRAKHGDDALVIEDLLGQAGVANAKLAYQEYKRVFETELFAPHAARGAQVQRPLWASTSAKDPSFADTKYMDALIGPHTVNTAPLDTLEAVRDHGIVAQTIEQDLTHAQQVIDRLFGVGIDFAAVTDQLLDEGVQKFADSYDALIDEINKRRTAVATSA